MTKIKCKGVPQICLQNLDLRSISSPRQFEFESFPSILSQIKYDREFKVNVATRTINN